MKYRSIKTPPVSGSLSLKDAQNAAKELALNGSHARSKAKMTTLKSGILIIHESMSGSNLTKSHSRSGKSKHEPKSALGQKGITKGVSAHKN